MKGFYDRKEELGLLNGKIRNLSRGELGVIYGRRRIGKSELLKRFQSKVNNFKKLFITVTDYGRREFMDSLSEKINETFKEEVRINKWSDFFDYLSEKSGKQKILLIIDEFQRIDRFSKDFIFSLQGCWDSKLKYNKFMLLICGSSMSMMHRLALEENGPLYGRKTFEIRIKPFRYIDFREMFKEYSEEEKIKIFSVFGGTPKYLDDFKRGEEKDLLKSYEKIVLSPNSALFEEPLNALRYELKSPNRYASILRAMSEGKEKTPEISGAIGIENHKLSYYFRNLHSLLDLIEPNDPIFGKKRNSKYRIRDNFFRFWYKFVYPYRESIEAGSTRFVLDKISKNLDPYCGRIFESIVEEFFVFMNGKNIKNKKIEFRRIGKWWGRGEDIDLVLDCEKEVVFIEIKFTNRKVGFGEYDKLVETSRKTFASGKFSYILVSRAGFEASLLKKKPDNLMLLSLEDLTKIWNKEVRSLAPPK